VDCGEVPNVTLAGVTHVSPAGLEADTVNVMVPRKLFSAVRETVDVPDAPAKICVGLTAPADIVKSITWNVITAVEFEVRPVDEAVTVTV
jgi:hypothetical protein